MLLLKRGMLLMLRWLNRGGWCHLLAYEKVLWWKAVTMSKKFYSAAISAAGPYLPKLACFSAAAERLHAVDPYHHRKSSPMDTPPNTSEAKANAMSNEEQSWQGSCQYSHIWHGKNLHWRETKNRKFILECLRAMDHVPLIFVQILPNFVSSRVSGNGFQLCFFILWKRRV